MRNQGEFQLQPATRKPSSVSIDDRMARDWMGPDRSRNAETLHEAFHRVAVAIANAESYHAEAVEVRCLAESFERMLSAMDFLPNSPTLLNAGTTVGVLSGCFVLPVTGEPDRDDDTLRLMTQLQQAGAGTGFSFLSLGDWPGGPSATEQLNQLLLRIDEATRHNTSLSPRRGANMGVLRVDHPSIHAFIASKRDGRSLPHFNLSVGLTDRFMDCAKHGKRFALRDPKTHRPTTRIWANDLLTAIAEAAWASGDPGAVFLDAVERANPVPGLGPIHATNPCGEAPLLPFESCTLGSINLSNMLRDESSGGSGIDWRRLARTTRLAVRFLDNVIDATRWPDERVAKATRRTRKIGLGVMGFADMLVRMRIAYDSPMAEQIAAQVMAFINHTAHNASEELADQRGAFPAWDQSVFARTGVHLRNATCTSIAPTGTLSRIASVNPGIEPFFNFSQPSATSCQPIGRDCRALRHFADETGHDLGALLEHARQTGTLADAPGLRDSEARLFRTATQISAQQHLRIQAAFQQNTDQSVSKTVNLPERTTAEEVKRVITDAWELGLKGVTVFRWGCRSHQPFGPGREQSRELLPG